MSATDILFKLVSYRGERNLDYKCVYAVKNGYVLKQDWIGEI